MVYFLIAIILVVSELAYFRIAECFNIIDKPDIRSSHTFISLRGGGIVFLFGAWLYAALFGLEYLWFLLGLTLVSVVSFIDDIHSLPNKIRLLIQFMAMFLMFYQLGILNCNDWLSVIIGLIVCVGIINAYNFMDGINGITGGYSLTVLAPLIYLNLKDDFIAMPFLYTTAISLLVFCFFNFRKKAKCFAGDVGSITIAFILLFALGRLIFKTGDFSYFTFLAVYGVDSVLTIFHRIKLHENLGEAHRKHAYQIMANELNISHVKVSISYMVIQLIISFGLIFCPINHYLFFGIVILFLTMVYIIFMKKYYHLHVEYLQSKQH